MKVRERTELDEVKTKVTIIETKVNSMEKSFESMHFKLDKVIDSKADKDIVEKLSVNMKTQDEKHSNQIASIGLKQAYYAGAALVIATLLATTLSLIISHFTGG